MCSLDHRIIYYNCSIILLVRVKFDKISFHDEFIDYSPCFLLSYSYILDHCSYVSMSHHQIFEVRSEGTQVDEINLK
jgi:hypothetical protein